MDIKHCEKRLSSLKAEFSGWRSHFEEISRYIQPRSGRFNAQKSKGEKKYNDIVDSTATRALRTLAAGMQAGMSSQSRQWYRLETRDQFLNDNADVKSWLYTVQMRMNHVFSQSNFYKSLHMSYGELGAFGTAAILLMEDEEDVIRCYPLTIGEFYIAVNGRGKVDTLYREFEMTINELATSFGEENLSRASKRLYEKGSLDEKVKVIHGIEPRRDYNPKKKDSKNKPFASVYFEEGQKTFLRESGFDEFPALVPRWDVMGGDAYGRSPGMEALGDVKQLQHEQYRKAEAIDKQTRPPLTAPVELKTTGLKNIPSGVSYVSNPQASVKAAYEVNLNLNYLLEDIRDVRQRIDETFYKDLFQMISMTDRRQITAREIDERHEEKLLMLGPVLENLNTELLDAAIERTYSIMDRKGLIPEPPDQLQGIPLKVEYVSMLAQAQKAAGIGAIDRLMMTVGNAAQLNPDTVDKFDFDEMIDQTAEMLGVNPNLVVSDEHVKVIREQRAKATQAAAQQEQMNQAAQTAKTTSEIDTEGENGLTNIMRQFTQL